jgi:hypothetical protein
MPTQDWNTIYSTDHEKWEELWRSQNPTDAEAYYRFEEAEIQAPFKAMLYSQIAATLPSLKPLEVARG